MKTRIQSWGLAAVVLSACSAGPGPAGDPEPVGNTKEAVTAPPVPVSLVVIPETIPVGEYAGRYPIFNDPEVEVVYSNGSTASAYNCSYTSSNSKVVEATSGPGGGIFGVAPGTATIRVTGCTILWNGSRDLYDPPGLYALTGTGTITVIPDLRSLAITPVSVSIEKGSTEAFVATGTFPGKQATKQNLTTDAVTWLSGNPSVATISSDGVATAVGIGTTTITALFSAGTGGIECLGALCCTKECWTAEATLTVTKPPPVDAGVDSGKPDSGTDSGKPDAQADATTDPSVDASIDSGEDAVADTGVEAEAEAAAPLCSNINLKSAPIVNSTSVQAAPPTMMGGPIVPGQYILQQIALYFPVGSGEGGSTPPTSQIIQVSATAILSDLLEYADPANGYPDESDGGDIFGEFVVDWDYTLTAASTMNYTYVCGASGTGTNGYTSSPTSLVLSYTLQTGTEVYTYSLAP